MFHRILSQLIVNDAVTLIANFYKYAPLVEKNLSEIRHVNILAHPDQERYVKK